MYVCVYHLSIYYLLSIIYVSIYHLCIYLSIYLIYIIYHLCIYPSIIYVYLSIYLSTYPFIYHLSYFSPCFSCPSPWEASCPWLLLFYKKILN